MGNLWRDVLANPGSNESTGSLSDLRSGCLSGSNSPDRLVSNNDFGPVADGVLHGIKLSFEELICGSSFSDFKALTAADDGVEAESLGLGDFGGNNLVGLSKESSSLRVSNDNPFKTEINSLISAHFTSESSFV